jgi:hypothetical protein
MKNAFLRTAAACISSLLFFYTGSAQSLQTASGFAASLSEDARLRIVLIRHAEKPKKGDNLTCQGVNRSMQLTAVLHSRFGLPVAIYVPSMAFGDSTKHSRMFQTIVPFAAKYNLPVCGKFAEDDTVQLARTAREQKGTVFIVWEHSRLPAIARCLGIKDTTLHWSGDDYDSIWIITYHDGTASLQRSKEGLHPSTACSY